MPGIFGVIDRAAVNSQRGQQELAPVERMSTAIHEGSVAEPLASAVGRRCVGARRWPATASNLSPDGSAPSGGDALRRRR